MTPNAKIVSNNWIFLMKILIKRKIISGEERALRQPHLWEIRHFHSCLDMTQNGDPQSPDLGRNAQIRTGWNGLPVRDSSSSLQRRQLEGCMEEETREEGNTCQEKAGRWCLFLSASQTHRAEGLCSQPSRGQVTALCCLDWRLGDRRMGKKYTERARTLRRSLMPQTPDLH